MRRFSRLQRPLGPPESGGKRQEGVLEPLASGIDNGAGNAGRDRGGGSGAGRDERPNRRIPTAATSPGPLKAIGSSGREHRSPWRAERLMGRGVRVGIDAEGRARVGIDAPQGSVPTVATPAPMTVAPCATTGSHQPIKFCQSPEQWYGGWPNFGVSNI